MNFHFLIGPHPDCNNISNWIQEYKSLRPNETVKYRDGGKNKSDKYEFNNISSHIVSRKYMTLSELQSLMNIRGTNFNPIKLVNPNLLEKYTEEVITSKTNRRQELIKICKLNRIGVSRASMILTTIYPNKYSIIDKKRVRSFFNWYQSHPSKYSENVELYDLFTKYDTIKYYLAYNTVLDQLAQASSHSHRELDMALWAYDEKQI